ncbi:MAG: hypothetical protein WCG47_16535, partial [Dermatophilaceae bacterium]
MQPSSLVFLVVIAIWAAYLVQYWVRRREHMSTARSVDRFSRAMRVLERRSERAEAEDEAGPAIRSSLVARAPARPSAGRDSHAGMPAGVARSVQPGRSSRLARRARAAGLLLTLAMLPVTIGFAQIGMVPWWSIALAFGVVGLCLVALRLFAVREQTARHTERSMRASGSRGARVGSRSAVAGEATAAAVGQDLDAPEASPARPAAQPAYRPGDPSWRPVPVPRPTYQLKDPAPPSRPEVTP